MKKLLTFSFSLLTACAAFAQQQYTFTNYTEEQGLSSGTIRGMFKDNTGYLWLMSEEGLSRFDGYSFKVFRHNPDDSTSIPGNTCSWGMQLANGDIYFLTWNGPRLYDAQKLSFIKNFPYRDAGSYLYYSFRLQQDSNALYNVYADKIVRVHNSACSYFPLPAKSGDLLRSPTASDSSGVIMFTTSGKIFALYAGEKQCREINIAHDAGEPDTTVFDIFYTPAENTFTAVSRKRLYRFSREQNKFIPALDLQQFSQIKDRLIYPNKLTLNGPSFFNNYYFAFTSDGNLYKLNMKTGEEKILHLNTKIPEEEIKDKSVNTFVIDKKGILWIGTPGMGLFRFNTLTDSYEQFIHSPGNTAGIPSNSVDFILPGEAGVVWIAGTGHGLVKMEPVVPLMESQIPAANKSKVISGGDTKNIRAFLETGSGYLVGTLRGLYNYDAAKKEFSEWTDLFEAPEKNIIGTLANDGAGNIWVGSWRAQVCIINPKNGKRISVQMPYTRFIPNADGNWQIRHLFYDSKNTVWIATLGGGTYTVNANEIDLDNPASVKLNPAMHDEKDASTISSNMVFTITEDAEGNIWAGAANGLNCFNRSSKKWIHYTNIPGDEHSIHGNEVRSLAFDKKGNMWVGTNGGGLNRYNKTENNFTHFTMVNGLPNDAVYSIVCDNSGMLWLGTNRGLCRFNPENYSCTNFTLKDGIQNYEFNTGAAIKLKDGTLLFGGVDGYNIIHPEKIEINKAPAPKVVVSSIKVFDREVPPGDGSVTLNHTENSLTFQFAALSFYRNQDNKYAYKLEPLNTEWIFCNDRRFVTYSNLEPGDYVFKVKASNSDGVWNETGAQLNISITPPWWKTWWFRAGFLLFAVLTVLWLIRRRTASLRKQKLILERTVNQRTADLRTQKEIAEQQRTRAEQSEKFKQQFLANMSHEIRTPMNAVMGMTNLLIDKNKNTENFKYLDGIQKSSDTLLHIINDILDFSKIEAGKIELEQIDFSIRDVVEQVKVTLHHKAEEKGLHLITEIDNKIPDVLIGDPVRLNQVLMNLAGNAVKFTEKGSVCITVSPIPAFPGGEGVADALATPPLRGGRVGLLFSVTDTGIGIPKDKLQTVFESFSQAHASDARKFGGTGLGLTISKQLVELMDGKISIESEEGSGTTFSFEIDFAIGSKERLEEQKIAEDIDGSILNGLKILVADDNEFNRVVAKDTLLSKAEVEIVEAHNGMEAVEWLSKKDFDVVLMDVQMPVMDGYEATRQIRSLKSEVRNHTIPVIALTASVVRSDLDKCREAGMNDYVPKPFKTFQLISAIVKATGREISFTEKKRNNELKYETGNNSSITNLAYLKKFCEGDKERMQKYIRMFLDSAPALIEKVNGALEKNDFEEVAGQIHAYKTKWIMMGMNESKDLAHKIEMQCWERSVNGETKENISNLLNQIRGAISELKNFENKPVL